MADNALNQGATPLQVAQAILSSQEYRVDVVENLYMQYLGRLADPYGLVSAVQFLESGGTDEQTCARLFSCRAAAPVAISPAVCPSFSEQ